MKRFSPFVRLVVLGCAVASCSTPAGDLTPDSGPPTSLGNGLRIKDVSDPTLPTHDKPDAKGVVNVPHQVTGATVLWVDTFDETSNGKSRGTVYVQDVDSQDPYSGTSIFSPSYVPGNLRVAPGDVLDLNGNYQENPSIGAAVFPAGEVLSQISKPVATFRFEYKTPEPRVVDVSDLDDYTIGRQWIGMLVTVKDVTLVDGLTDDSSNRRTGHLTSKAQVTITNELMQLPDPTDPSVAAGTKLSSLTGIVTYFFEIHIAPRTAADIVK